MPSLTLKTMMQPTSRIAKEALLSIVRRMEPDAFERLCQRVLRESAFTKVEVTGRSGDGIRLRQLFFLKPLKPSWLGLAWGELLLCYTLGSDPALWHFREAAGGES